LIVAAGLIIFPYILLVIFAYILPPWEDVEIEKNR